MSRWLQSSILRGFLVRRLATVLLWSCLLNASANTPEDMVTGRVTVTADEIRSAVEAHVRESIEDKAFYTPDTQISVQVLSIPYHEVALLQTAKTQPPLVLEDTTKPPIQKPMAQQIMLRTESTLEGYFSDRAIVRVSIADEAGSRREFGVPVKISIKRPVWVVQTPVVVGQTLSNQNFRLEARELGRLAAVAVGSERTLSDYCARVNLRPGTLLDAQKIDFKPLVKRFETVHIQMIGAAGLQISLEGIPLQDGKIGDAVRVRNSLNRNKTYLAKVVGPNRVQVEM